MKVTLEDVKKNKAVQTYIRMADESLRAMGYTEQLWHFEYWTIWERIRRTQL